MCLSFGLWAYILGLRNESTTVTVKLISFPNMCSGYSVWIWGDCFITPTWISQRDVDHSQVGKQLSLKFYGSPEVCWRSNTTTSSLSLHSAMRRVDYLVNKGITCGCQMGGKSVHMSRCVHMYEGMGHCMCFSNGRSRCTHVWRRGHCTVYILYFAGTLFCGNRQKCVLQNFGGFYFCGWVCGPCSQTCWI